MALAQLLSNLVSIKKPDDSVRRIDLNQQEESKNNKISTTRYTYWNFILFSILEQFKRVANCYFLFVAIISTIPGLSPTGPYTAFLPIVIVVIIGMFKEAIEDIIRRKMDNVFNHKKTLVYRKESNTFEPTKWQDIVLGDFVQVQNTEQFPCDLLLIESSNQQDGLCFVETSNLDGETNLKVKTCHSHIQELFKQCENIKDMKGYVECEVPNNNIDSFDGKFHHQDSDITDQLCLRGSFLRNTDHIIGLAVFNGCETKIAMSSKKTPKKTTNIEHLTNKYILFIIALELLFIISGTVGYAVWTRVSSLWYLKRSSISDDELALETFKSFWTIFILINQMIPISLYITLEITKLLQARMMMKDLKMYDEESDRTMVARSLLHEDLGQINMIFSDKTGTLTENKMNCVKLSIGGMIYGVNIPNNDSFFDKSLSNGAWMNHADSLNIQEFLLLLAVCNTVIVENGFKYHALSPDEIALVKTASLLGIELVKRTPTEIIVKIFNKEHKFQILQVLEFTSERKRQSIIVRHMQTNEILLLTKGADSVIIPIIEKNCHDCEWTKDHVLKMGKEGLRTLVCGKAILNEQNFNDWLNKYKLLKSSSEKEEFETELEQQLSCILGSSGIEDKLQDQVQETITKLRKAGIKIWILTGDKQETAINIGYTSGVFNSDLDHLDIVQGKSAESVEKYFEQLKVKDVIPYLVVDGDQIEIILNHQVISRQFLEISIQCKSVVCSRISPKQKADIVNFIKRNMKSYLTLAIGDGANDCGMIQSAHIGCGIMGKEGMQASNIADYAFVKFANLQRLLLVHGRWNYRRIAKFLLLSFYKNSLFYLTQLWFLFHNGFSGTTFQDKWNIALFNTVFTFLQVIMFALIDKDVEDHTVDRFPELYKLGHKNEFYNFKVFIGWMLNAVFQSLLCFYIPFYGLGNSKFVDGQDFDLQSIGIVSYMCVLCVITIKLSLETANWNWVIGLTYFGFILGYLVFFLFYSTIYYAIGEQIPVLEDSSFVLQTYRMFGTAQFWAVLLLTIVSCCLRDFFWKCWVQILNHNSLVNLVRNSKDIPINTSSSASFSV